MPSSDDDHHSSHRHKHKHKKHKHSHRKHRHGSKDRHEHSSSHRSESPHSRKHQTKHHRERDDERDRKKRHSTDNVSSDHDITDYERKDRHKHSSRQSDSPHSRKHQNKHHRERDDKRDGKRRCSTDDMSSDHDIKDYERKDRHVHKKHRTSEEPKPKERFREEDESVKSTSEEDSSEEETPVFDVDWESYRGTLSKIFFRDNDLIQRGTDTYDDFWEFLKKYLNFKRKKATESTKVRKKPRTASQGESSLGVPQKYDRSHRINFGIPSRDVVNRIREDRYRPGVEPLTERRVEQFKEIYLHYLDFLQKQKFTKLVKIQRDQQNLPIYQYKSAIVEAIREHQVVVVAGDTGCGKSTQVPQYLLEAGFQQVACTQPRRIACISLSKRVAYETLNEYGSQVAYQVRFEKTKSQVTRILFLTEGLLLRQMTNDPLLERYSVIVIDEVHERHIHTDFLLGVVKCLLQQRADLKLVLMSATINIDLFSNYFDRAPVVKVPGRLYPIELQYLPISAEDKDGKSQRLNPTPYLRVLQLIEHKYPSTERGDVLIFLSGLTEIMTLVEAVQAYAQQTKRWIVLPLHSALSIGEQDKVFDFPPEGVRKCIVSTNIAETSVTIDGVRFVIDSGKVKEMSYDSKCKMQRLQEFWISRASSEQRKGRSGRTGPGVCFRLYAESDYNDLQPYSTPEIHRVPLNSLVLQMVSMGLRDARRFPFIEPPASSTMETAIGFLIEQNALTNEEELTPVGQMLSQLPVDVVVGKMLIMGSLFHMTEPILSIASALSVQSPFTARAHSDSDAMNARKPLESDHGDAFTLLNAFDEWVQVKANNQNNSRKWCRRRGLEEQRFYEMTRLKTQFHQILKDHGLLPPRVETRPAATSYERQKQHAEKRKLRGLKRDQQRTRNKRKILKVDEDFTISGDEDEEDDLDANIRDLEFRLTHDLDTMQDRSNESQGFSLRQITLLKIILCSGLYPQVAIADDCNANQGEPMFHTKSKPFVTIHPTSIFSTKKEVLELSELDIRPAPGGGASEGDRRYPYSNKHQLLAYVSLLETTKPYLTGVMRVPALQTLTLYSTAIDTNADCTRMVFDSWLEVRFGKGPDGAELGEMVLSSAVQLRTTWQLLVQAKIDAHQAEENEAEPAENVRRLERTLAAKLTEFLYSDIVYSMRRVLAADLAHLYVGPAPDEESHSATQQVLSGLCKDAKPHPIKGGLKVNDYLTFNCLQDFEDGYTSYMQRHWTCPTCNEQLVVTVIERIQHEQECSATQGDRSQDSKQEGENSSDGLKHDGKDALRKQYHCTKCGKVLMLTVTEILKHKKQCTGSS